MESYLENFDSKIHLNHGQMELKYFSQHYTGFNRRYMKRHVIVLYIFHI